MSSLSESLAIRIEELEFRLEATEAALREIVEHVGRGCSDIVVANTVLGRIRAAALAALDEEVEG